MSRQSDNADIRLEQRSRRHRMVMEGQRHLGSESRSRQIDGCELTRNMAEGAVRRLVPIQHEILRVK